MTRTALRRPTPIVRLPSKDETHATEYSRAATRGNWNEVRDSEACRGAGEADRRKKANAVNDDAGAAAE